MPVHGSKLLLASYACLCEGKLLMSTAVVQVGIQGNLDPAVLYGPKHIIKERAEAILRMAGGR